MGGLFLWMVRGSLRFRGIHKRLDLQDGLSWIGVGVDGDCLGLVVLLSFGIELDLDFTSSSWGDGLLGALRHSAPARAFALVQEERLASGVGEFEDMRDSIALVHCSEVVLV